MKNSKEQRPTMPLAALRSESYKPGLTKRHISQKIYGKDKSRPNHNEVLR